MAKVLISPDDAAACDAVFVDATWFMPGAGRTGQEAFAEQRIPGAVFFDIDEIADPTSALPHMAPGAACFSRWLAENALDAGARFVVYDQNGFLASARAWWTFARFGLDVRLLDGGPEAWRAAGRALETDLPPAIERSAPRTPVLFVRDDAVGWADVLAHVERGDAVIVDARPAGRFAGTDPEPRPGLASGHIPGSVNLPFRSVIAEDGRMKTGEALEAVLPVADRAQRVITTCGSGVTAAILHAAFTQAGFTDLRLYDGSWTEWAGRGDLPVVTGG